MKPLQVGCCISAHGFGHAARTMAIMEALSDLREIELQVATQVPEWFIRSSFSGNLFYHPVLTDIGLVQRTPLEEDIPATIAALADFYPVRQESIDRLAAIFADCDLVVCDISPAGILAAKEAAIPSVLVENFTWDWIYEGYSQAWPELKPLISYLRRINTLADYRVQTIPVCAPADGALVVAPVARAVREGASLVRERLQIPPEDRLILVSMGGIGGGQLPLARMAECAGVYFVVSGVGADASTTANLRILTQDSTLHHPDLVAASDAVIGKAGYSTLAEVYQAGVPFGYVTRPDFRESGPLATFIRTEMKGMEIRPDDFQRGGWLNYLDGVIRLGKREGANPENGAGQCARFLMTLMEDDSRQ